MMYSKGKGPQIAPDAQARDKLAVYVYEYLMHVGAKNSAQSFLRELNWEKNNIPVGDAPGFLLSWWFVFWDLYCAAPERRDQFESSQEAKVFHDLNVAGNPMNQMPPNQEALPSPVMPHGQPGYFGGPPNPQQMIPGQGYQRYPSQIAPRPIRTPSQMDFGGPNSNVPNQNQMNMDSSRMNAGMSPLNRLTPPINTRMPMQQQPPQGPQGGMNQMPGYNGPPPTGPNQGPQQAQMRGANNQQNQPVQNQPGAGPNQMINSAPMSPMPMQQPRWANAGNPPGGQQQLNQVQQQQPPSAQAPMNYSSSSPVPYGVHMGGGHHGGNPGGVPGGGGPGTPIISSPQDATNGGDGNYMMKNVQGGMQFNDPNLGHMVPMGSDMTAHAHLNGAEMQMQANRHHEDHANQGANVNTISNPAMGDLNNYAFGEGIF